jgi:t-SNARE complex subunit (syntaxin)
MGAAVFSGNLVNLCKSIRHDKEKTLTVLEPQIAYAKHIFQDKINITIIIIIIIIIITNLRLQNLTSKSLNFAIYNLFYS